jgi:protein-ribulosamine 3-kinase
LQSIVGITSRIIKILPVSGGSINNAYHLKTAHACFFLKTNQSSFSKSMFDAEASGLRLLKASSQFTVPEVILVGEENKTAFILMEWIETGPKASSCMEKAGEYLAKMHQSSAPFFGLNHPNFIGSLPQSNNEHESWNSFFIEERLKPLAKLASAKNLLQPAILNAFERLYPLLPGIFPDEPPALLHGDLWSGNFMSTTNGNPSIFDPAVYYGNREMDLAMTKLFGGFTQEFYHSYERFYPLEKGWEERTDICNLYPLLVHVNLFGGSYIRQVEHIMERF